MKLSEKQIQENYNKAKEQEEQQEKEHEKWYKRQGFLTEKDREFLVQKLRKSQSYLGTLWERYRSSEDYNEKERIYFDIDLEQHISQKIQETIVNNKF